MAGDTVITVVGNLTDDPELRFTPSGAAVANFTVASTPRFFDKQTNDWKDGDALFLRCSIWRQAAENVAETLTSGARVIVQGRLKQRSYETREGEKRTVVRAGRRRGRPLAALRDGQGHQATVGGGEAAEGGGGQQGGSRPGHRRLRPVRAVSQPGRRPVGAPAPGRHDRRRAAVLGRSAPSIHPTIPADARALKGSTTMAKPSLRKPKKKVCQFCKDKATYVDYKDTTLLRKFVSDRGKIRARRVTGNCTQHQRDIAMAVKNAREMALMPYTSTAR